MIWMRSGRKFSTKPMSAMPGRWMSLTVISRREASVSVSCSSCSSCRWSSNRRATLSACTLVEVLSGGCVVRRRPVARLRRGLRAVAAARPALAALALVLETPELLLQPVGGEIDRDLELGGLLAAHELVMVEPQLDLRTVTVALCGHGQVRLADVARELSELLETLLGVEPDARIELTMTRRGDDLHLIPHAARWESSRRGAVR